MSENVVTVQNLIKHYKDVKAVDGISFAVKRGEIFGIVGPNGAGKTTTIECIASMRRADSGSVDVLGLDPVKDSIVLKRRIGLQQQESEIQDRLRLWEAMELFSSFYDTVLDWKALLKQLNLWEKKDSFYSALSGGQKKRFFVAMALIGDPEIVFLDEFTSGLDPQSRISIWKLVKELRDQGRTIVLSTHYMDEAEKLCDRVAIIDHGKLTALDSPSNLISMHGGHIRVQFDVGDVFDGESLSRLEGVESVLNDGNVCTLEVSASSTIVEIVKKLDAMGQGLDSFRIEAPTLEDVFLNITGREVRD
ncbi:MAG: ABC transporter ATP-binding protein [Candidatus Sabulitectum sp.]|nr:ABC transporter ATP-binding protein [Candidatus Sabulitectum sp.]